MTLHYDREGTLINLTRWARLLEDHDYRVIAMHHVSQWRISTAWFGIDYSFGEGPPLIFETMVFHDNHLSDDYCARWSTVKEAREGHEAVVDVIRSAEREGWDPIVTLNRTRSLYP